MEALVRAADRAGQPLVTLLRNRALKARVTTTSVRRLDPETVDQLRRIGVNLNQAMRLANATRTIPPELVSAAAAVEDFLTREIAGDGPQSR